MNNTIIDLWYGNIAPCDKCGAHDPEVNRFICLAERNRENLCSGLTDAQKELFQKYTDCTDAYLIRMLELAFCEGFSLGSKLAAEALV